MFYWIQIYISLYHIKPEQPIFSTRFKEEYIELPGRKRFQMGSGLDFLYIGCHAR